MLKRLSSSTKKMKKRKSGLYVSGKNAEKKQSWLETDQFYSVNLGSSPKGRVFKSLTCNRPNPF